MRVLATIIAFLCLSSSAFATNVCQGLATNLSAEADRDQIEQVRQVCLAENDEIITNNMFKDEDPEMIGDCQSSAQDESDKAQSDCLMAAEFAAIESKATDRLADVRCRLAGLKAANNELRICLVYFEELLPLEVDK